MPILSRVGRRSLSVRITIAVMYLLLSVGAVTIVGGCFVAGPRWAPRPVAY